MRVLITNPETDAFTRYLRHWSKKLIADLRNVDEIFHLEKKKANRKRFEGMLKKKNINIVLLHGHGGDDFILGDNGPHRRLRKRPHLNW